MGGTEDGATRDPRMLWGAVAAVLVVLVAVAVAVLGRPGSASPTAAPSPSVSPSSGSAAAEAPAPAPSASGLPKSEATLVLGDSLGLVVYPWLADLLPDRKVTYEAEVGRTTGRTADRLAELDPASVPRVVIVSSGTNDPETDAFRTSAARLLELLGPDRCVVWFDVVRPDSFGDPQGSVNDALQALADQHPNVRVVPWSAAIDEHGSWLGGDGIHPTQEGAKARAGLFAEASTTCSALDPSAPRAPKQELPESAFWAPSKSP